MIGIALRFLATLFPNRALRTWLVSRFSCVTVNKGAHVGVAVVLDVDCLTLGAGASLGHMNVFRRAGTVTIGDGASVGHRNGFYATDDVEIGRGTSIGHGNRVQGATWLSEWSERLTEPGVNRFSIGERSIVTAGHFFDVTHPVSVGDRTTIAGRGTEIWTHGVSMDRNGGIDIGNECYIASGARLSPGTHLGDHCLVGLGSVVVSSFDSHSVLVGNPARQVRSDQSHGWKSRT